MARVGFVLPGLVMALFPTRVRETFEQLAFETPGK